MKSLIIKLGALGDIIMSTPIIKSIQHAHGKDELYLLTSPAFAGLFVPWPGLTTKDFPRTGAGAFIKTITWLRSQKFDRIYDLQSNDRSRLICTLSGAGDKVGNHKRFPYTHHPGDIYTGQNHIFDRHKQVIASVGFESIEDRPWLPVPEQNHGRVVQWLENHGLNTDRLVLMHAGASKLHPLKRWPYFADIAQMLSGAGYEIIWLGAGDDALINTELAARVGVDATNGFSIVELIALAELARFAITNDSGPMHVLSCADLPIFAFFGPSDWRRNHAIDQRERVISLNKSNSIWRADDFEDAKRKDLASISAEMVGSFLQAETDIKL
jgi:ADP-heptose:LPS heptosyltransferase